MFWTSMAILRQFDEPVEKTLRIQMDMVAASESASSSKAAAQSSLHEDSGVGSFFRSFARLFDSVADQFRKSSELNGDQKEKPAKPVKKAKPDKQPKQDKQGKLIQAVEPVLPVESAKPVEPVKPSEPVKPAKAAEPEPPMEPPKIEIPEFIFPEEQELPKPEPQPQSQPEPESKPEAVPSVEEVKPAEPVIEVKPVDEPVAPVEAVKVEPVEEIKPVELPKPPEPIETPKPPEPIEVSKPAEPEKKLEPAKPVIPVQRPVERVGFFAKFKAAWNPKPKKSVKSVTTPKPVQPIKPPKPAEPAKVVQPAKAINVPQPKSAGFGKKFADFFKPKPRTKPVKPIKPSASPKPGPIVKPVTPITPPEPEKPALPVEPVKAAEPPKPAKPVKPVPAPKPPKPKKEKIPTDSLDHIAFWPPWLLGVMGIVLSAFRDFGFEGVPALLWGLMGWSIGLMIRLVLLYRSPVTLTGQIVLADEQKLKGEVVFKEGEKTIFLNRLGRWDIIPRLFGLSNPRQLLRGDVTLTGWRRGIIIPSVEVHEVRADKAVRKSTVRSLRWAFAIMVFVIALIVYLSLD
jgi:hypothetical protein